MALVPLVLHSPLNCPFSNLTILAKFEQIGKSTLGSTATRPSFSPIDRAKSPPFFSLGENEYRDGDMFNVGY